MAWEPIETAPRDRTRILLYLPESRIANAVFGWCGDDDEDWMMDCGDEATVIDVPVTHWMAEPDAPDDVREATMKELGR